MALGQLQRLPPELASNPFYPLLVKFSRLKMGSLEWLFTVEGFLLRYAWIALFALFALALPPLEEVDLLSTLVRLTTLIYPCFCIWSLTRLSGVELMQCMIEGHWLADLLAVPIDNDDLIHGFATPLWIITRQYALMSIFSLVLYALETHVVVVEGQFFVWELARPLILYLGVFFSAVAWIVCIYMARLTIEARVRGGLLKGIATLCFLLTGMLVLACSLPLDRRDSSPCLSFYGSNATIRRQIGFALVWLPAPLNICNSSQINVKRVQAPNRV